MQALAVDNVTYVLFTSWSHSVNSFLSTMLRRQPC